MAGASVCEGARGFDAVKILKESGDGADNAAGGGVGHQRLNSPTASSRFLLLREHFEVVGKEGYPPGLRGVTVAQIDGRSRTLHGLFSQARSTTACTTLPGTRSLQCLWQALEEDLFYDPFDGCTMSAILDLDEFHCRGLEADRWMVCDYAKRVSSRLDCLNRAMELLDGFHGFEKLRRHVQELETASYMYMNHVFVSGGESLQKRRRLTTTGWGGDGDDAVAAEPRGLHTVGDELDGDSSPPLVGGEGQHARDVVHRYLACYSVFGKWMVAYDIFFHMVLSFLVRDYDFYSRLYNPTLRYASWCLRRLLLVCSVVVVPRGGGGDDGNKNGENGCWMQLLDVNLIRVILGLDSLRFIPADGRVYHSDIVSFVEKEGDDGAPPRMAH